MESLFGGEMGLLGGEGLKEDGCRVGWPGSPLPDDVYSASHFALITAYHDIKTRLAGLERENSSLKRKLKIYEIKFPTISDFGEERNSYCSFESKETALLQSENGSLQRQVNQLTHEICLGAVQWSARALEMVGEGEQGMGLLTGAVLLCLCPQTTLAEKHVERIRGLEAALRQRDGSLQKLNSQLHSKEVQYLQLHASPDISHLLDCPSLMLQTSRSLDALSDLKLQRLEAELEGARHEAQGACRREAELKAECERLQEELRRLQEAQRQQELAGPCEQCDVEWIKKAGDEQHNNACERVWAALREGFLTCQENDTEQAWLSAGSGKGFGFRKSMKKPDPWNSEPVSRAVLVAGEGEGQSDSGGMRDRAEQGKPACHCSSSGTGATGGDQGQGCSCLLLWEAAALVLTAKGEALQFTDASARPAERCPSSKKDLLPPNRVNLALAYTELTEELCRLQTLCARQTEILRRVSQEQSSPETIKDKTSDGYASRKRDTRAHDLSFSTCIVQLSAFNSRQADLTPQTSPLSSFLVQRHSPVPQRHSPVPQRHSPVPQRHSPAPQRRSPVPQRLSPDVHRRSPLPEISDGPASYSCRPASHHLRASFQGRRSYSETPPGSLGAGAGAAAVVRGTSTCAAFPIPAGPGALSCHAPGYLQAEHAQSWPSINLWMETEDNDIRSCPLCQLAFPIGYPDDALIKHIDTHLENSKI
ncbi:TBKB1 protein, partial [Atractosteus spatula]|nr:TBKB1 protein [Atractosteus spatula]